jgi:hypothetical protein
MSLPGGTTKKSHTVQSGYAKFAIASYLAMTNIKVCTNTY